MRLETTEKILNSDFAMQSSLGRQSAPRHVAVIMDGNGRWAERRGQPRTVGHRAGARAVRRTLEAAPRLGIETLTLYAFSSDNWRRPVDEVDNLMRLFEEYLRREVGRCLRNGVRLTVIGRRDRLSASLIDLIERAERSTRGGSRLAVRLAVDYSARHAIVTAARRFGDRGAAAEFGEELLRGIHSKGDVGAVDLLVRTGGERRLSDFLLWECAYAELFFTDRLWPDFSAEDLEGAVADYRGRDRRFGRVAAGRSG